MLNAKINSVTWLLLKIIMKYTEILGSKSAGKEGHTIDLYFSLVS